MWDRQTDRQTFCQPTTFPASMATVLLQTRHINQLKADSRQHGSGQADFGQAPDRREPQAGDRPVPVQWTDLPDYSQTGGLFLPARQPGLTGAGRTDRVGRTDCGRQTGWACPEGIIQPRKPSSPWPRLCGQAQAGRQPFPGLEKTSPRLASVPGSQTGRTWRAGPGGGQWRRRRADSSGWRAGRGEPGTCATRLGMVATMTGLGSSGQPHWKNSHPRTGRPSRLVGRLPPPAHDPLPVDWSGSPMPQPSPGRPACPMAAMPTSSLVLVTCLDRTGGLEPPNPTPASVSPSAGGGTTASSPDLPPTPAPDREAGEAGPPGGGGGDGAAGRQAGRHSPSGPLP